jgi:hypothetical protein
LRVGCIEDHVVEPEIVVDDAASPALDRTTSLEPRHDVFAVRHIGGPRPPVAIGPPCNLALHIALRSAEVLEPDRFEIDRVQLDVNIDQTIEERPDSLGRERQF